jgi:small-conductance mechanosensitive channel
VPTRPGAPDRASLQAGTDDAATPSLPALLFALLGAAVAWTLHLLVAYVVVALDCSTRWSGTHVALAALTVVTLGAAAASGLLAHRLWMRARAVDRPTDDTWDARMGDRTSRVSFLMMVGVVLAVLFAISIVYQAVPLFFVAVCSPAVGS